MLQHSVAAHLANKLHHCLEYIQHSDMVSWHFRLMHLYCGCILKEDIIGSVTGRGLFLFIRKRIGLEGCYLSTPGFAAATFEAFWLTSHGNFLSAYEEAKVFSHWAFLQIPSERRYIVISGGVASNAYILGALQKVGDAYGYSVLAPPARLCCDNAEMVAWNGIELIRTRSAIPFSTRIVPVLGTNLWFIFCNYVLVTF